MHEVMRYFHFLFAFALMAGAGATHIVSLRLRCVRNTAAIVQLASLRSLVARAVLMPAAALTIIFGIGLSHMLGHSLTRPWLLTALVATLVMVLAGMMMAAPATRKIRQRAQELADSGVKETDELKPLAGILAAYAWSDFLVTALIIYLMVVKPGV